MDTLVEVFASQRSPACTSMSDKSRSSSPTWYMSWAGSPGSADTVAMVPVKPPVLNPEAHVILKNDLEFIKAQLQAQTKAFQALSHSVTLLEQESNQQQDRIKQLEEDVQFGGRSTRGEKFDSLLKRTIQEVWLAMAKEMEGLQCSFTKKENSMENLSHEFVESKKLLWGELESVQDELQGINKKIKDQERDITRNLIDIKKIQGNQVKCAKFLTQLSGKVTGDSSEIETNKVTCEELNEIWSAVNTLRNSFTSCSNWNDKKGILRARSGDGTKSGRMNRQRRRSSSPISYKSGPCL